MGPPGVVVGEGLLAVRALIQLFFGVAQPVHLQVVGNGEALSAVVTGERLLAHVEQRDMGLQVRRLSESLAAGGAEERPLSSMCDHVRLEVGGLGEPLPTLSALVGLQSSVCAVVQFQTLQGGETFATLDAVVGPEVLMGPLVAVQAALQLEAFSTRGAFMWFPFGVSHLMELQTLRVAECLHALGAGQQLLVVVRFAVEVEALVGDEHLVTDFAAITLLPLVHLQVLGELLPLVEAVPTEPAFEGFGPRVCPVVGLPVPLQSEGLVTVRALVRFLAIVDVLMDDQAHQGRVGFPTLPALIGFQSSVDPQVGLQVRLLIEAFGTLGAVDHLPAGNH